MTGDRGRRGPRPIVVVAVVALLAGALGLAQLRRDAPIALGDRGPAEAVAHDRCRHLNVTTGGLFLRGEGAAVREEWRGRVVVGRVVLDERIDDGGVAGTFTTEDGATVPIYGGREGADGFGPGCAPWTG